jgi:hypothetical protein
MHSVITALQVKQDTCSNLAFFRPDGTVGQTRKQIVFRTGCFRYTRQGPVRVFRQKFTPEDAIGSHTCSLEARAGV